MKSKKKKSDNQAGHDGVVERPQSSDLKGGSPGHRNRSMCCNIKKQATIAQQKGLRQNMNYHQKNSINVTKIEKLTLAEKELIQIKKQKFLLKQKEDAMKLFGSDKNQSSMLSNKTNEIRN